MAKVRYWWSEDGVGELCVRNDTVTKEDTLCYHCDCIIPAGSPAAELTTSEGEKHILHKECADKNCEVKV